MPARPAPPTASTDPDTENRPAKFDLSVAQVAGGALAAMTAAALGSRLGVAGTVTGAALASITAAVAGALYTTGIRHTRERVRGVRLGRVGDGVPVVVPPASPGPSANGPDAASTTVPDLHPPVPTPPGRSVPAGAGRLSVRGVLIGALGVFLLAAVGVTGLELVSGAAFSGGSGTTVSEVRQAVDRGPSGAQDTDPDASPEPSEAPSPEQSDPAEADPEPTESAGAPTEPSPAPADEPSTGDPREPGGPAEPGEPAEPPAQQESGSSDGEGEAGGGSRGSDAEAGSGSQEGPASQGDPVPAS